MVSIFMLNFIMLYVIMLDVIMLNVIMLSVVAPKYFDVGVTFEMREPNTEKSIFRLIMIAVSQHLLNERVKGKEAERQREREE
jgi:hypothetical protein